MLNFDEQVSILENRIATLEFDLINEVDPSLKINNKHSLKRQKRKLKLYTEQKGICCFCDELMFALECHGSGQRFATIEHIVPRSCGGSNKMENLKLSHSKCNNVRGTMNFWKFKRNIEKYQKKISADKQLSMAERNIRSLLKQMRKYYEDSNYRAIVEKINKQYMNWHQMLEHNLAIVLKYELENVL